MRELNEIISQLRLEYETIARLSDNFRQSAIQGFIIDDVMIGRISNCASNIQALRNKIDAVLKKQLKPDNDYSSMKLDDLENCVAECELNRRLCDSISSRLSATVEALKRDNTPLLSDLPVDNMHTMIIKAHDECDINALRELEEKLEPYSDLYSALRGEEALRRDPGLIGRLERHYPQIAWFIRAQGRDDAQIGVDTDLSEKAISELRKSRSDEDQLIAANDIKKTRRSGNKTLTSKKRNADSSAEHSDAAEGDKGDTADSEDF